MTKPSLELTQHFLVKAHEINPFFMPGQPFDIPITTAIELAQEFVDNAKFAPVGDSHHDAIGCPHCRGDKVIVVLDPNIARRFVAPDGPWSLDDERAIAKAVKQGVDHAGPEDDEPIINFPG